MGFYLDIHSGEGSSNRVTSEQTYELLLQDGAYEDEEGRAIWFAGGMGGATPTQWKQQIRQDREVVNHLLQVAGLPLPPEEETATDRELASFRYSWCTSPDMLRDCIRKLLDFCQRYGLRLYDGQADRYITTETIDIAIESLTGGRTWVEGIVPPVPGVIDPTQTPAQCPTPSLSLTNAEASETLVVALELSVRCRRGLQRMNIRTLGELASQTESDLLKIKNFGMTSLNEIKQQLAKYNLSLRSTEPVASDKAIVSKPRATPARIMGPSHRPVA